MRTHFCGLVDETLIGQTVTLAGWTDVARNLGGVCFIDLRDHEGIVQVTVEPVAGDDASAELFKVAASLGYEDVLQVEGVVRARHAVNDKLRSGKVEVIATRISILNKAAPLPFHAHENPGEETRLKYRYLDLRRPEMQRMQRTRIKLVQALRRHLDARDFQDIETPILTKATPEGARDFLVPARMHPGEFYALPQSPQLFKQILMVAGFDRYYQIARCFRDEALRADRQLEFTQLDMEFAFVRERDVQDFVEDMIRAIFKEVGDVDLAAQFPRMTWAEAMRRFGSDKPDLRIALELVDVAELVKASQFPVFTAAANDADGRVAALRIPGGASLSRKQIDEYAAHAAKYGAKGLAYIKLSETGEVSSPIAKFFSEESFAALLKHVGAGNGDIVFFGAGGYTKVSDFMGALRLKAGKEFDLIADGWAPLWVTDFPMFEWDEEAQRYVALHHPFTAPAVDDIADLRANARTAVSRGYDMVLNGNEIGGGSIRIHRPDMQSAVFELLGIGAEEARAKFGFLLDALNYGAPPHGGIAFGIDRIAALMAGTESIRDVIPFPKTTGAQDLMTDAPSPIAADQLAEVHVQVRPKQV
ncbi:aspartate--tRNA ligase [Xanthomonas citri pv. malvacearum]|uniref:Aspartate--tRNA ligase n=1 Tax=Xanthomonas campestris pv. malvacearum TaxID=86040 RepID=A0AA44Z4Q5_XANCM|nr:aspartate--tRNA ligase [Xanthomonas citri]OOW63619.1 aspartate--tRNA ligase [Xanthomonas campestris pv. thespesiae]OOW76423.1 aspartate--tRNA ligase [Xanthomonas campestris pv. leeana]AOL18857.1 aspartate--tRNA ligase [Xanthomonas citri pv. malvacearum]ASN00399.1 aspartate--tRNA(Asp/Asn) ligase [Xanthomonas citri pv. malvacearum]ASN10468.1 aspartate--tRNA(Asp/Asn) ligase [Xanthomonas citri pv. malvacearum]